mgnify:FL=1
MKVTGLQEVQKTLSILAPKEASNILRSTVHGVAGEARDVARSHMSTDTGKMKASTKTRRRKQRGTKIRSDVMVTKAAFYWRFREYGQGPDGTEDAMFLKATEHLRVNLTAMFREQFGKKFEARMARLRKG